MSAGNPDAKYQDSILKLGAGQKTRTGWRTVMTAGWRNKDRVRQSEHHHKGKSVSSDQDPRLFPWVSVSHRIKLKLKTQISLQTGHGPAENCQK